MNRNVMLKLAAGFCVFMPSLLKAADAEPAQIRLSHGVFRYDMAKTETDDGAATEKTETSGFTTFPAGLEIAVFWNGFAAYAYPETNGASSFLFGKAFGGNQEAGVSLSINSRNVKDGDESSYNSIGAYYFYSRPLTSSVTFEFDFNPALIMGSDKSTSGGTTEESDGSGYSLYLDFLGVIPIAKNFEYVFGIDYLWTKAETKVKASGASTTEKEDASNLGLILAKFRYFI